MSACCIGRTCCRCWYSRLSFRVPADFARYGPFGCSIATHRWSSRKDGPQCLLGQTTVDRIRGEVGRYARHGGHLRKRVVSRHYRSTAGGFGGGFPVTPGITPFWRGHFSPHFTRSMLSDTQRRPVSLTGSCGWSLSAYRAIRSVMTCANGSSLALKLLIIASSMISGSSLSKSSVCPACSASNAMKVSCVRPLPSRNG